MIRLSEKVEFSARVNPVRLPMKCVSPTTDDAIAVGSGAISNFGPLSKEINFAVMKIISLKKCRQGSTSLSTIFFRKGIFCAQNHHNLQSVCKGDSGGPLVSKMNNTLIGIASFIHEGEFYYIHQQIH